MKKTKIGILYLFIFFCFFAFIYGSQINISDIRYSEGPKFVKIQFLSDSISSVPKLLPYDETSMVVEMRFFNVQFKTDKNEFIFDSDVVEKIDIVKKDSDIYDVKIYLKQNYTDYRISTNSKGVFIEFKRTSSGKKVIGDFKINNPIEKKRNSIQSINVYKKGDNMVGFKIALNHTKINYKAIPIYKSPCRLAIDFNNTKYKAVNHTVNYSNVKGIRGALNNPDVYRVVFDLDYLKNYKIYQKDKNLFIDLFDEKAKLTKNNDSVVKTTPNPSFKTPKKEEQKAEKKQLAEEKIKPAPIKVDGNKKTIEKDTPVIKTNEDKEFFKEPKAQSSDQDSSKQFQETIDNSESLRKTIDRGKEYSGEPMDISLYDADLKDFITMIAKKTGLNITWDPGVEGRIRGVFHQVPWDQALELFLKQNGLAMQMEGNILRIADADKLAKETEQLQKLEKSREMQVELQVITRDLNYANAKDVSKVITKYLSPRGQIQVDERTNKLIIQETPGKIGIIDKLINEIDTGIPQVSIEARIVETKLNYKKNLGVQWGYKAMMDARYGNQTSLQFPNSIGINGATLFNDKNPGIASTMGGYAINLPASERNVGTLFSFGNVSGSFNLDVALTAMQSRGKGRVISAPKTTVLNNKPSEIVQGAQIPIQTIVNQTVSVRFQQASLELKVLPQITPRGTIITSIEIHNDAPDFSNLVNGIPPIITQQTKTTVEIADGDTLVIGGMYRVETDQSSDQVPLLSKIPIIGGLFKNSANTRNQKELLIFITPRIIK